MKTGIDCDVSFDVTGGIMMGKVFLILLQQPEFTHARSLIVLVKYWLKIRGYHEPFNGGLGSYSVLIMVVSLLQHHGKSGKSLSELFQLFFTFYGTQFNWITTGISLMQGGSYFSKKIVSGNFDSAEPWKPALEDCCDATNNISSSSYNFPTIRDGFRATAELLASKKKAPCGLLSLILAGSHLERIN
jgi:non-canonical poly(A) RNA polymerase PAPD5/7